MLEVGCYSWRRRRSRYVRIIYQHGRETVMTVGNESKTMSIEGNERKLCNPAQQLFGEASS